MNRQWQQRRRETWIYSALFILAVAAAIACATGDSVPQEIYEELEDSYADLKDEKDRLLEDLERAEEREREQVIVERVVEKEVPIEVIREVEKEVPVEVIKEVVVEKEVPVEVIKEVVVEKEVPVRGRRLDKVKARGRVICASRDDFPGFAYPDSTGNYAGFDIDLCRAVATAVLGDPSKIEIRLITAAERGPAIRSGEVDMLVRTVTWTMSRDSQWGNYAQTMFYDGQGFMVPAELGIESIAGLDGARVCVTAGTTTELDMADFFARNNIRYEPVAFQGQDEAQEAYAAGLCDALTTNISLLAAFRSSLHDRHNHIILRERISEEPLGPVTPHGDDQWFDIVKTVMSILINAEAMGVNSRNVDAMAGSDDWNVARLLGLQGSFGQQELGLDRAVARTVIEAVGNYGEIYERNLGPGGLNLPRDGSANALWRDAPCSGCPKGGQIYAAPLR